jgi:hypothetical protein
MYPYEAKRGGLQRVGSFRRACRRIRTFSKSVFYIASNSHPAHNSQLQTRYQASDEQRYHLGQFSFEQQDSVGATEDWFASLGEVPATDDAGFYHALTTNQPCLAPEICSGSTKAVPSEHKPQREPLDYLEASEPISREPSSQPRTSVTAWKLQRRLSQRKAHEQHSSQTSRKCDASITRIPRPHNSLSRSRNYVPLNYSPERIQPFYNSRSPKTAATQSPRVSAGPVSNQYDLFDYSSIPLSARLSGSNDHLPFTKRRQQRKNSLAGVFGERERNIVLTNESPLSTSADADRTVPLRGSCDDIDLPRGGRLEAEVPQSQNRQLETQIYIAVAPNRMRETEDSQLEVPWVPPPPRSPDRPTPYFVVPSTRSIPLKSVVNSLVSPEIESEKEKALRRKSDSTLAMTSGKTSPTLTSASHEQANDKLLDEKESVPTVPVGLSPIKKLPKSIIKRSEDGSPVSDPGRSRPSSLLFTAPLQGGDVGRKSMTDRGIVDSRLSSAGEDKNPSIPFSSSPEEVGGSAQTSRLPSAHCRSGVGRRKGAEPSRGVIVSDKWKGKQPMPGSFQDEGSSSPVKEEVDQEILDIEKALQTAAKHHSLRTDSTAVWRRNQAPPTHTSSQSEDMFHNVVRKAMKHHGSKAADNSLLLSAGTKEDEVEGAFLAAAKHLDLKTPCASSSTSNREPGSAGSSLRGPRVRFRPISCQEQVAQHFSSPYTSPDLSRRSSLAVSNSPPLPILRDGQSTPTPRPYCGRPNPKLKSRWNRQKRIQEVEACALSSSAMGNQRPPIPLVSGSMPTAVQSSPDTTSVENANRDTRPSLVPLTSTSTSATCSPLDTSRRQQTSSKMSSVKDEVPKQPSEVRAELRRGSQDQEK